MYCGCCCVCFFKQKTAYEMRISDWSSDVCSSDLAGKDRPQPAETGNPLQHEEAGGLVPRPPPRHISSMPLPAPFTDWFAARGWRLRRHQADMLAAGERGEHALLVAATGAGRSEERRVGKGGVSTGGSRWAPYL